MMVKLHKMVDEGMAERPWADGIIKTKFEDLIPSEDLKDSFLMGEFDVIKELLEKVPETKQGKVNKKVCTIILHIDIKKNYYFLTENCLCYIWKISEKVVPSFLYDSTLEKAFY